MLSTTHNDARDVPPNQQPSVSRAVRSPSVATSMTAMDPPTSRFAPPATTPTMQGSSYLSKIRSSEIASSEGVIVGRVPGVVEDGPETDLSRMEKAMSFQEVEKTVGLEMTFPEGMLHFCSMSSYGLMVGVLLQHIHEEVLPDVPLSILNLTVGANNIAINGLSFFTGRLGDKFGYKRMIGIGAVCTYICLLISAFISRSLPLQFVFQGFLLGSSHALGMPLYMSLPSQFFQRRRGLATGIAVAGSGIGGGLSAMIIRGLLPKVGYRNTVLIYSSINASLCFVAWFLLKVRDIPVAEGNRKRWLPRGIWNSVEIYSLMGCIGIGTWGFLTPYYFLTPYTRIRCPQLDPNGLQPAVPLILTQFLSGIGRVCAGQFADFFGPVNTIFASFFLGGMFQLVLWPFTNSYGAINAFAVLYGFFGSSFLSLLPAAAAQLFGLNGLATIVGVTILASAPAQFVGATISGVVLTATGGSYKAVAYYAGSAMLTGACLLLFARFKREPRIFARF